MADERYLIKYLGLAFRSWIIRCCSQVFNTKEGAHRSTYFPDELSAIVSVDVRRDAERDELVIEGKNRNVRGCCQGRWDSSSQLSLDYWSVMTTMY